MQIDLATIPMSSWIMVGLGVVYFLLPATSPIKAWINKLIGGTVNPPNPNPNPNPTPSPVGFDINALLQLLTNLFLKAKAAGDTKQQESIMATIEAVQTEQSAAMKSAIPSSMLHR